MGGEEGNAEPADTEDPAIVVPGNEEAPREQDGKPHHVSIREGRAGADSGEGEAGHGIEDPTPEENEGGELPNPPANP